MTAALEMPDVDVSRWGPGVKFYSTDDGRYFVVLADLVDYIDEGAFRVRRQTTRILYTDEYAHAVDLEVDFEFDPGTTHEEAVQLAGFDLSEG